MSELMTVRSPSLPPKRVMRVANKVVGLVLRSPMHRAMSTRLLLLTYTGRKSGKRYRIPLDYQRDGDAVTVVAGNPWWANLRGGAPVALRIAGEELQGFAVPVEDKAIAEGYLMAFLRERTKLVKMYNASLTPEGQPDPASVKEAVNSQVVVRIALA